MADTDCATRELKAIHLLKSHTRIFNTLVLDKTVTLAATGDRILMKVDELELAKRFKHLLDIALGQIEVK